MPSALSQPPEFDTLDYEAVTDNSLPAHIMAARDPATGRVFYMNHESKQTTWLHPSRKPFTDDLPWPDERLLANNGRAYYANHQDRTTSFKHPVTGEVELEIKTDARGRRYYVNHDTRSTSWLHPDVERRLRAGDTAGLDGVFVNAAGNYIVEMKTDSGESYTVNFNTDAVTEPE